MYFIALVLKEIIQASALLFINCTNYWICDRKNPLAFKRWRWCRLLALTLETHCYKDYRNSYILFEPKTMCVCVCVYGMKFCYWN